MVMMRLFDIALTGQLDRPRLEQLRKLLDLEPKGRLTDTEDAEFGHRSLRDVRDEWAWLNLWRRDARNWHMILTYAGPRPAQHVIDRCEGEVLGAAAALSLAVATPARVPLVPVAVPAIRALSVRFSTFLGVDEVDKLSRALELRHELGGMSGTEFGWRYLRWDPAAGSLLWQLLGREHGELVLLYDTDPPTELVVEECRLRAEQAAASAGVAITDVQQ